ncbi:hypothetical protein KC332_g16120, partial [Hortaea werneckii]
MSWFNYLSDIASSFSTTAYADQPQTNAGPLDTSGEQSVGKDVRSGGVGTAQHDRDATTRGGASTKSPVAGSNEESGPEKEANAGDAAKAAAKQGDGEKGHTPGEGGEASGQKGPEASGPHGGSVKALSGADSKQEDEGEDGGEEE